MASFILGFEKDLSQYPMREILFWILTIGLFHFAIGQFIEKKSIAKDYLALVRYSDLRKWWRCLCGKILLRCAAGIALLFFVCIIFQNMWQAEYMSDVTIMKAYFLYFTNMTIFSFLALLIINCWNGEKICFAIIMFIEVCSLYGGIMFPSIACYLPGSFAMYRRCIWHVTDGFWPIYFLAVEIALILLFILFGYRWIERGVKNG